MSIKSVIIILVLSIVVAYGGAILDFVLNISKRGTLGLPFGFSSVNFLGTNTNMQMLFADIVFWFLVIWGIWKLLQKNKKKKKKK